MSSHSEPRLPAANPLSRRKIELIAAEIIRRHYPELLHQPGSFPLTDFVEFDVREYGYKVGPRALPPDIEGVTDTKEKTVSLREDVYEDLWQGDGRARFTTSHELGHVFLHDDLLVDFAAQRGARLFRKGEMPAYVDPEWQADSFAAALLMPIPPVVAHVTRNGRDPVGMGEVFGASKTAAGVRLKVLEQMGVQLPMV